MQKYIDIVKKELTKYMSTILEKDYNKDIFEEFLKRYIEVRYYNVAENIDKKESLRNVVLSELEKKKNSLIKKYDKEKIENMYEAFCYIIYFDNVGTHKDIQIVVDKIVELRKEKLKKKENKTFEKNFKGLIKQYNILKEEYIGKFEVDYFKLKNKKIENSNLNITSLGYNIKFPKTFKVTAIQKVYKEEAVREDKMFVEYNMVKAKILRDIIKGDFNKEYILEFETAVLSKKNKSARILSIIENEFLKEKINLLIEYKKFTEDTKNDIYALMRQGYKIAVKLDETTKTADEKILNRLDVFSYILIDEKQDYSSLNKAKLNSKKIVKIKKGEKI